ncbi:Delta(12)-fatty-acid desaturase [Thalassocella blandensis]|nr:Delta(12)-fatty-acid desaturase [Thalassocella blandensis]
MSDNSTDNLQHSSPNSPQQSSFTASPDSTIPTQKAGADLTSPTQQKFRVTQLLSPAEIQQLQTRSNTRAWLMLTVNWLMVFTACALVARWPNIITILLAFIIIGGRQLGLAILMHECSHFSFFESKSLNNWVGKWLLAAPVFADLSAYRKYHLKHHRLLGTEQDPDYPNYKIFPIAKSSLKRKLLRDITGVSGVKNFYGLILMYSGVFDYDLSFKPKQNRKLSLIQKCRNFCSNFYPAAIAQLVLLFGFYVAGYPQLYLLWFAAFLTTFSVFSRIRNAAEHANVEDLLNPDPRFSTRTTQANWLARLTVAPNFVNYHLEHHLIPAVPAYNLAKCHHLLVERNAYEQTPHAIANHYWDVLAALTR